MNKKIISGVVIAVLAIMIAVGGYIFWQQYQPQKTGQVMKVAKYYWPGTYWVEIADQKGWFKEAGLNVELVDTNPDYYQSLADTASGKIDTVNFPPFDLVEYNAKGADLVVVFNSDVSNGVDGIVARAGINSINDLKDKRVAVAVGTYLDYFLNIVLEQNGLDPQRDIFKIDVSAEESVAGFIAGKYDAIVNWQPNLSEAADRGNGTIIFDSSQIQGLNFGNWVFKRSFINDRPEDVRAFVGVWNKTTDFIESYPDEAYAIIADIYKVDPQEAFNLAKGDKIVNLDYNLSALSFSLGLDSIHGSINKINDYLINKNIISKRVDSLDIVDTQFIMELAK